MKKDVRSFTLAVASVAALAYAGCKKDSDKAQEFMEITSVLPAEGSTGDTITISGKKFSPDKAKNTVTLNGNVLELYKAGETELQFILPHQASSGKIKVKAGTDSTESATGFVVTPAVASLTSFSPESGNRGSVVTLKGTKMLPDAEVFLNGKKITEFEQGRNLTTIAFKIPEDGNAGKISIKQNGVTKEFPGQFTVTNIWTRIDKFEFSAGLSNGISFTHNGYLYFGMGTVGGESGNTNAYYKFLPSTGLWTYAFSGFAFGEFASMVQMDGKYYLGGGLLKDGSTRPEWSVIDPEELRTSGMPVTNFPKGFWGGIAFAVNGKMYAGLGSQTQKIYQHDMSAPSPYDWKWNVTSYSSLCLEYASSFVIGNYVYVVGGTSSCGDGAGDQKVFRINPETGELSAMADLPQSPVRSKAFSYNGKGYVVTLNGTFFEYDPAGNSWSRKASTNIFSNYAAVMNDRFYTWSNTGEVVEYIPGN